MGFLICTIKKGKSKLFSLGNTEKILVMASVVCKMAAEKISLEKKISEKEAMNLVLEGIEESQNSLIKQKLCIDAQKGGQQDGKTKEGA